MIPIVRCFTPRREVGEVSLHLGEDGLDLWHVSETVLESIHGVIIAIDRLLILTVLILTLLEVVVSDLLFEEGESDLC
jgi:hypothetical protein